MTDGMRKRAEAGKERMEVAKGAMGDRVDAAREATSQRVGAAKEATGERVEAAKQAATDLQEKVKPKLRGWIHEGAFPVSILAGAILVIGASGGRERLALGIYAISLSALLGTSALYHRVNWKRPSTRRWMRRLDHSMIFLLIAGTLTPFALLVLDGTIATAVLVAVWCGAAAGIMVELVWTDSPKWVSVGVYLAVGWIGAFAFPAIIAEAGIGAGALIATGGILYTIGGVIYALQRPNPRPATFGYHEIFHVLVVAAAAAHFAAIAFYAGPFA